MFSLPKLTSLFCERLIMLSLACFVKHVLCNLLRN